jgi:hypothetical protein
MVKSAEPRPVGKHPWEEKVRSILAKCKKEGVFTDPSVRELDRLVADLVRLTNRLGRWLHANTKNGVPSARPVRLALEWDPHCRSGVCEDLEFVRYAMQQTGSIVTAEMMPQLFPLATRAYARDDAAA